jgi:branched-subunit amino acid transport protein
MSPSQILLVFVVIGIATYAIRSSFFILSGRIELPRLIRDGLQFIPAAVLTALIIPSLARYEGAIQLTWQNPRLLAGLLAVGVAYKSRNVLLTLAAGMIALWILQFWMG